MIRSLTVYCGANMGSDPQLVAAAKEFGQQLAQHDISLVYGGGRFGIMGTIARAVMDNGGTVHGVITTELRDRGAALDNLTTLEVVPTMDIRKQQMMKLGDGMVALPGGVGTLEEISEAASWTTIGDNHKPAAFYNVDGYYDPLKAMFYKMHEKGFLEQSYLDSLYFTDSLNQLLNFMNNYHAPDYRHYHG